MDLKFLSEGNVNIFLLDVLAKMTSRTTWYGHTDIDLVKAGRVDVGIFSHFCYVSQKSDYESKCDGIYVRCAKNLVKIGQEMPKFSTKIGLFNFCPWTEMI